jgi:hypothetical protein
LISVLFVLLASSALDGGDKAEAQRLLAEGNALMQAGRAGDALEKYEEAYRAYASPKIQFNVGEALLELGRRAAAADAFASAVEGLDEPSEARAAAAERLAALKTLLGSLEVDSTPTSSVAIDGRAVGATPLAIPHVDPGVYEVTFTRDGDVESRTVRISAAQATTVSVTFRPEVVVEPPPPPEPPGDDRRWWLYAGAGAAVVVAAVVVVAVLASGDGFVPGGELGRSSLDDWGRP